MKGKQKMRREKLKLNSEIKKALEKHFLVGDETSTLNKMKRQVLGKPWWLPEATMLIQC